MASINEKINYINETKSLIKDKLNDLGSEIENETTFREYAEKIENLYEEWPKINSDEDIAINLNNTKKGKVNTVLKGNTKQNTTTGKNLWHLEQNYGLGSGVTMTKNADGSYTFNGTATGGLMAFRGLCPLNETHTISCTCNKTESGIILRTRLGAITDFGTIQDSKNVTNNKETLTSDKEINFVELTIPENTSLTDFTVYIQLEIGSSATDFEQYTKGIPAPSVGAESPIQTITGNNKIIFCEKNIFNLGLLNGVTKNGVTLTQDEDGGFLLNGTATATGQFRIPLSMPLTKPVSVYLKTQGSEGNIMISLRDSGAVQKASLRNLNASEKIVNYTPQAGAPIYILELAHITSGATYTNYKIYPMIINGTYTLSTVGEYEKYQEETYTINLGNLELHKFENIQDYIYKNKNDNNWYKKEIIRKRIFNGNENWTTRSGGTSYAYQLENFFDGNSAYGICNHWTFLKGASSSSQSTECMSSATANNFLSIFTNNTEIDTVEKLKNYLSTNNVILYHTLATATDILITDVNLINQLNILEKAKSYEGQTNVSQAPHELPFILNISALLKNSN